VPIRLLPEGELSAEDCYVPAGWAILGGVSPVPRRRVWVPGFVMRRTPVTNAQYLVFLDDLVARGREEEALRRVPRERSGTEQGQPIYGRDADGRFVLVPDEDGDCWEADWPVILVDWHDAAAFAAWEAERTGQAWRLASEWEREKAARGVDGRDYPWGDHADPSWSCNRYAHAGRPLPGSVEAFPEDVSPYGVRGLAGNVMDWCLDDHGAPFPEDGGRLVVPVLSSDATVRSLRGGAWTQPLRLAKAAQRQGAEPHSRFSHMGFRLARSVADPPARP
jgi:serine/threonine-protein kinase